MSNEARKFALVTAGDIQLMSAIIGGMFAANKNPVTGPEFANVAFEVFDAIKAENETRSASALDDVRRRG